MFPHVEQWFDHASTHSFETTLGQKTYSLILKHLGTLAKAKKKRSDLKNPRKQQQKKLLLRGPNHLIPSHRTYSTTATRLHIIRGSSLGALWKARAARPPKQIPKRMVSASPTETVLYFYGKNKSPTETVVFSCLFGKKKTSQKKRQAKNARGCRRCEDPAPPPLQRPHWAY